MKNLISTIRRSVIVFVWIVLSCGCASFRGQPAPEGMSYAEAVNDASVVKSDEIYADLIPIDAANDSLIWNEDRSRILVVSWKSEEAYQKYVKPFTRTSENEGFVIWVTTAPQVQRFCKAFVKEIQPDKKDLELRIKQYLGLNEAWEYDYFIEMWVSPDDLFRPCVDPEVNDSRCELNFGKEIPKVKGIADYPAFYKNLYFSDFRTRPGVPWTGLGYTYDWGSSESAVGASEFIIVPKGSYEIERIVPTMQYCQ